MVSRKGDKTWTHAERDSTRVQERKAARPPAASLDEPTVEQMREAVADQWCWWCDRGPWRSLGGHTAQAHGITAAMIRELAGWLKSAPIASAELREQMSKRPSNMANVAKAQAALRAHGHPGMVMSEAGLVSARARLDAVRSPEQARAAGMAAAAVTSKPHPCPVCGVILPRATPITCSSACRLEVRRRTARAVGKGKHEANRERDEAIVLMSEAGMRQSEIARRVGLTQSAVSYVLRSRS